MQADDETAITDIEIAPDGRIYVFGASREVLELIRDIGVGDEQLLKRIDALAGDKSQISKDAHNRSGNST